MAAAGSATGCVNPRSKNKVVPSSLLENVDADKPLSRRYSLGMDEFVDKSAYEKENRPLSLSLGRKKKAKASTILANRPTFRGTVPQKGSLSRSPAQRTNCPAFLTNLLSRSVEPRKLRVDVKYYAVHT